jgi:hypothetical protein
MPGAATKKHEVCGEQQLQDQMDFGKVVRITERVKQVVELSNEVKLKALNASLIAKRAGESAKGFQVVSAELRVFSQRLDNAMRELSLEAFALVGDMARIAKERQRLRLYRQVTNANARIAEVLTARSKQITEAEHALEDGFATLFSSLNRTRGRCDTGGMLSRFARIEAVYGGEFSNALRQVATEVEDTIARICQAIKGLESRA